MLTIYRHIPTVLWICLGLFVFRVTAQWVQWLSPLEWLPAFGRWQGSNLSYPLLFAVQFMLIVGMAAVAWRVATRRASPNRRLGVVLMVVGLLYFFAMALRLLLGVTVLADRAWFATVLPALFHLVLATFVLTWGAYHRSRASLVTEMHR